MAENNIYQKMNMVVNDLQAMNVKKTGYNKHKDYTYYELGDFLPYINELCREYGIHTQVWFTNKFAYLRVVNVEKPTEKLLYTSPSREANLPGGQPIQNLGAEQTYQRRYLYMAAFGIVEHDLIDRSNSNGIPKDKEVIPKNKPTPEKQDQPASYEEAKKIFDPNNKDKKEEVKADNYISLPQQKRLWAMAKGDEDIVRAVLASVKLESTAEIKKGKEYEKLCDMAEKMAANNEYGISFDKEVE